MPISFLKMGLRNKVPRPEKHVHLPHFGPPPEQGEIMLGIKSLEPKVKKKSKRQIESEALAEHMKGFEERFKKEQEERTKLLGDLPF